jgi:hypothetical protein
MPETTPDVLMVAIPAALRSALQVPPEVASLKVVVRPGHTEVIPVMPAGSGFMVTMV